MLDLLLMPRNSFSRRGLAQAPRDMGLSQIAERDGPLSHPMAFTDACALGAFVLGVVFCAAGCVPLILPLPQVVEKM